jgi:hypothetical protein
VRPFRAAALVALLWLVGFTLWIVSTTLWAFATR